MKIRRFVARDMKTALAQIKEELGADAVIMSNKKIPEGVELMAAIDYAQQEAPANETQDTEVAAQNKESVLADDSVQLSTTMPPQTARQSQAAAPTTAPTTAPVDSLSALLNRQVQHQPELTATPVSQSTSQPVQNNHIQASQKPAASTAPLNATNIEEQFKNFTERLEQSTQQPTNISNSQEYAMEDMGDELEGSDFAAMTTESTTQPAQPRDTRSAASVGMDEISRMQKEMSSIRQLLENQVSGLMWQDMAQRDPRRAYLVNRLTDLGLTEQVADQISGYIPEQYNEDEAWDYAKKLMVQQLNTTHNEIVHRGGVFSLVGPTGVGKTTTIAKLAARFAQIHGADQVVLISTDNYRIAGFEQLATYGRIIGCQVKQAHDIQALDTMLQQFSNKKLILIDTAGMGQRDMRLVKHLTTLVSNARVRIRNYLVLSANTQQKVMQENVDRFKTIPLSGCIFTKLDESVSAGELIATSIQNALPIGYLTDGQRVPEDIKVANTEKLVTLADAMARKYNPSPEMVKQTMPPMQSALV